MKLSNLLKKIQTYRRSNTSALSIMHATVATFRESFQCRWSHIQIRLCTRNLQRVPLLYLLFPGKDFRLCNIFQDRKIL